MDLAVDEYIVMITPTVFANVQFIGPLRLLEEGLVGQEGWDVRVRARRFGLRSNNILIMDTLFTAQ